MRVPDNLLVNINFSSIFSFKGALLNIGNPSYPFLLKISSLIDEAAQQEGSQLSSLFSHWNGAKETECSLLRATSLRTAALKQIIKPGNFQIHQLAALPLDEQLQALKAAGSFERFLQIIPHLSEDGIRYLSVRHLRELGVTPPGEEVKTKKVFKLFLRAVYEKLLIELKAKKQPDQRSEEIVEISCQIPLAPHLRSRPFGRFFLCKIEKAIKEVILAIKKTQGFKVVAAVAALAVGSIVMFTCTYTVFQVYKESLPYLQGLVEQILGHNTSCLYAFWAVRYTVAFSACLIEVTVVPLLVPSRFRVILVNSLNWVYKICFCDLILGRKMIVLIYRHIARPTIQKTYILIGEAALAAEGQLARRFYWQLEVAKKQWGSFVAHLAEPQLA
ncbi:MAG: hypothetical protein K0S07_233 [Chlamydiales bacterium]|jgi:hypothetical protein|nr:hypothetical protein [Chlamydiales bacterium]